MGLFLGKDRLQLWQVEGELELSAARQSLKLLVVFYDGERPCPQGSIGMAIAEVNFDDDNMRGRRWLSELLACLAAAGRWRSTMIRDRDRPRRCTAEVKMEVCSVCRGVAVRRLGSAAGCASGIYHKWQAGEGGRVTLARQGALLVRGGWMTGP